MGKSLLDISSRRCIAVVCCLSSSDSFLHTQTTTSVNDGDPGVALRIFRGIKALSLDFDVEKFGVALWISVTWID